jgi:hypothetical protein
MEYQDVKSEVVSSLRKYGFYIFDKSRQDHVREIMRVLGDLRSLVKIRSLPQNPNYFLLEVDSYTYEAHCRDRCSRNGVLDPQCYNKCLVESLRSAVDKIVAVLSR